MFLSDITIHEAGCPPLSKQASTSNATNLSSATNDGYKGAKAQSAVVLFQYFIASS